MDNYFDYSTLEIKTADNFQLRVLDFIVFPYIQGVR